MYKEDDAKESSGKLQKAIHNITREKMDVGLGRFELPTSTMSTWRSNQLSYKPVSLNIHLTLFE